MPIEPKLIPIRGVPASSEEAALGTHRLSREIGHQQERRPIDHYDACRRSGVRTSIGPNGR
jgi:hypothetical protein